MPEFGIETHELREKLEEMHEHTHGHGGHAHNNNGQQWTLYLSLSTAMIAVFAAIGSLQAGAYANHALLKKNESVLAQARASDEWAYYQSKSVKANLYAVQSELVASTNKELSQKWDAEAKRREEDQTEIQKKAKKFEKQVEESGKSAEHDLHVHHIFAMSVTIFQIAIALSAVSALTKRKFIWFVSLAASVGGLIFFIKGFLAH